MSFYHRVVDTRERKDKVQRKVRKIFRTFACLIMEENQQYQVRVKGLPLNVSED